MFAKGDYESAQNSLGKPDDCFLEKNSNNLIINLEDILLEEQIINDILISIHHKKLVTSL